MKIFLDTSSLVKLYHKEIGTDELIEIIRATPIQSIYLSEITEVEFLSTIWKKVRTKEISAERAEVAISLFVEDTPKYTFIAINNVIIEQSGSLMMKYGVAGLRTLDSLQLSTAVALRSSVDKFITADKLLQPFFVGEDLKV
jgi:predicted nucleic acid-binding protein